MQEILSHHWHHLPAGEVTQLWKTDPTMGWTSSKSGTAGSASAQTSSRPAGVAARGCASSFSSTDPLIYILLARVAIKLVMGGFVDAAVILAVVLINAWIGYLQEAKAERAIEALARSLVTENDRDSRGARTNGCRQQNSFPATWCCCPPGQGSG